jgi:N-acetylmuramic acid 6-phosphate etherase
MTAGTAHKMVLNMISTTAMIKLGMTYSNWMINVSMNNRKLRNRGLQILQEILGVNPDEANRLAGESGGNLKVAVIMGALGCSREEAEKRLQDNDGNLRRVIAHLGSGRE